MAPWWSVALLAACAPEPPAPEAAPPATARGPDILLVTIDTLRADRVGCYGDPLAATPNLDALAAEGALFREAHTTVPLTLPAHASMLSGRLPARHGLRDNAGFRLPDDVPLVQEALRAAGWATAAFVSAYVLDRAWGLDRGFDLYRAPFHPEDVARVTAFGELELSGAEVVAAAAAWWRDAPRPRFAWVHLYDPHAPWRAHAGWEGDPYRGEVAHADALLGRLLREVGEDALVVVAGDHGESLWEGGEREHGVLLARSATRVPLVVRPPGGLSGEERPEARTPPPPPVRRPAGADPDLVLDAVPDAPAAARVVEVPVSIADIGPTLAEWAGVELPGADGRSLRPLVEGEAGGDRPPVFAETFFPLFHYGWAPLRMVQDAEVRVELGARTEATRWREAPWGPRPGVPDPDPARVAELVALARRLDGEGRPTPGPVDAATAERLRALGYVAEAVPAPEADDAALPDPRDEVDLLARLHAAEAIEDPVASARALRAIVAAHPDLADARIALALALAAAGDRQGALAENLAVLERWPEHPTALSNAAVLARALGDGERALELARRMQAINPRDPRGYRIEAAVWVDRENAAEVLRATAAGLEVAPDDPNLHYLRGLAELQVGDPLAAVEHLEAARRAGSRAGDIDLWVGAALDRAGRVDEALAAYRRAVRAMEGDLRPLARAGVMLARAGRCEEARSYLVNAVRRGAAADPAVREAAERCLDVEERPAGGGDAP